MARGPTAQLAAGRDILLLLISEFQLDSVRADVGLKLGRMDQVWFSGGDSLSLLFSFYLLVTLSKLKGKGVMKWQELIYSTNSMLASVFNTAKREE